MRAPYLPSTGTRADITDLYDEKRRTFLVQYPVWLIVATGLTGILAFMLVGFLGFRDIEAELAGSPYFEPAWSRAIFHQPWPLYVWGCALIMLLQASVLRHPVLRRRLVATMFITVISIVLVGVIYYYNAEINTLLQNLLQAILGKRILLQLFGESPWVYTVLNFLLLAIFWSDTLRRWARRAQGRSPGSNVEIDPMSGTVRRRAPFEDLPTMQELISGDLIAAAILTSILALLFRPEVLNTLSNLGAGIHVTTCTVSWPIGNCAAGGVIHDPPSLSFVNLIQALIYLPLGLIILALSATVSGLGAIGGVNEDLTNPVPQSGAYESSTVSVSEQVSLTVLNTLRSALNRRIRLLFSNLALSLRNAMWPLLILVGVMAVAVVARDIQFYLHLVSNQLTCGTQSCPDYAAVQQLLNSGQQYQAALLGLTWSAVGVLSIVFSLALLVFKQRVAGNTLRFLGLIGFILLLTFWIFSLALSGFNAFLSLTNISHRVPFPQPGAATILSATALLVFGSWLVVNRWRSGVRLRQGQTVAVLREREQAGDFDVVLLYDKHDAPYVTQHIVRTLRKHFILPLSMEIGAVSLPPVDQVRSAIMCLGRQGAAAVSRQDVASLLADAVQHKIPVAAAFIPGFQGAVPAAVREVPRVNLRPRFARVMTSLEPYVGKVDPEEYRTYADRKSTVRQGLKDPAAIDYSAFGLALFNLMGITDLQPVTAGELDRGEAWTGSLPHTGLGLPTSKAVFFIRASATADVYQSILEKQDQFGCVLVVDVADLPDPSSLNVRFPQLVVVWIKPADIQSLLEMNRANLARSVKRLITRQVNEGLYPYKTDGRGKLFFGRTEELKRLSSSGNHGGIIMGAHRSGKSSLLHKLKEELLAQQRVVVGPIVFAGVLKHDAFFESVQRAFEQLQQSGTIPESAWTDTQLTLGTFASSIRRVKERAGRIVFLIDEVDSLLEVDESQSMSLTRIMRALKEEELADFYMAGHSRLRNAIVRQESPLRNFAAEITLTGLDEPAALSLIQKPMEQLGYDVTAEQAHRICRGTAGVAWLIQHFCISLLRAGEDSVDDRMIQRLERDASYLQAVWDHYQYGLDAISFAILVMAALHPNVTRHELLERFSAQAIQLSRSELDEHLDFLIRFGVITEVITEASPAGYHVLSLYLQAAIESRDPDDLLTDYFKEVRRTLL